MKVNSTAAPTDLLNSPDELEYLLQCLKDKFEVAKSDSRSNSCSPPKGKRQSFFAAPITVDDMDFD